MRYGSLQRMLNRVVADQTRNLIEYFVQRLRVQVNLCLGMRIHRVESVRGEKTSRQHQLRKQGPDRLTVVIVEAEMAKRHNAAQRNMQSCAQRCFPPDLLYLPANIDKMLRYLVLPVLPDSGKRRSGSNAFCPVRAADETGLGRLHHGSDSGNRSHRVAVA